MQPNIQLFYGEDDFHIRNKVNQLIRKLGVDDFNVTTYDLEETPIEEAVNDAMTIPFMSEWKVVVAKNAWFLSTRKVNKQPEHNRGYLGEYLENPTEETLFILTVPSAKLDNRSQLVKTLKHQAEVTECRLKSAQDLSAWIKRQLANAGVNIERDALAEFVRRIQGSTEMAYSETRKLLLYAEGMASIDKDIVKRVVTRNVEENVYEITNALLEGNHRRALEVYRDLTAYSEDPLRVLGVVVGKYREMMQVKTLLEKGYSQDDVQHHYNVKSGRAYYMVQNAKQVSRDRIEKHLKQLEDLDYSIKSGRLEKRLALELFILNA